jgi:hypothetical protein
MKNSKNIIMSMVMITLSCISFSLSAVMTPSEKMRALRTQKANLLAIGQPIMFTQQAINFERLKEFIIRDLEGIRRDIRALAETQRVLIEIMESM